MTKRKKHHRHGKNKNKKQQTDQKKAHVPADLNNRDVNLENTLVSSRTTHCCTPSKDINRLRKKYFEMETPIQKIPLHEDKILSRRSFNQLLNDNLSDSTPVNKRRSLNRQKERKMNESWNVTNLNVLFNSPIAHSDSSLAPGSSEKRRRSVSSIPKLHSPGKEKPLSFHKGTQTITKDELEQENRNSIIETPRVTEKLLADIDMQESHVQSQYADTKNLYNPKYNNLSEVNVNPYIKQKEVISLEINSQLSKWRKEESVDDMSFFLPQFFDKKSSSTPIQGQKRLSFLKDTGMKENLEMVSSGKLELINNKIDCTPLKVAIHNTPRSGRLKEHILNNSNDVTFFDPIPNRLENVNLNTPPLTEKVISKDKNNSIKWLGSNKRRNSDSSINRIQNRTSPKMSRLINHSRMFSKNINYSRIASCRRISLDYSRELGTSNSCVGMYEKLLNQFKRYSKASAKWSTKMMEACAQLGIQIKNSLTSLCNMYNVDKSLLNCSKIDCNCELYKLEVSNLNVKIGSLNEELTSLRRQIEEYHYRERNKEEDIEKLHEELNKVRKEMVTITELRSELTSLKEQFHCFRNAAPVPLPQMVEPVGPPTAPNHPPPPPPPPPPMPTFQPGPSKLTLMRKAKSSLGMGSVGDSRPVISLDDILKVKLKKASERPAVTPVRRHRPSSSPLINEDLFRQVKLRPSLAKNSAGNMTTVSTPGGANTTSPELPTSPASSLNRLLETNSVWRVKRLRKVGRYSFDSVHRKTQVLSAVTVGRRDKGDS